MAEAHGGRRQILTGREGLSFRRQAIFWSAALAAALAFLWLFSDILLPFIMGMALAYLLDPIADRLQRAGLGRLWATLTILLVSVLLFAMVLLVLVPVLGSQLMTFLARLPALVTRLQEIADELFTAKLSEVLGGGDARATIQQFVGQAAGWLGTLIASLWAGGQAIVNIVSLFVVTPVVAFYLLLDWDHMIERLDALLPREHVDTIRRLGHEIDTTLAGFVRGQLTVCVLLGTFYAVGLSLVGLNFGVLIGSTAGVISFIPYIGTIVGFFLSVGVALVQFWPDWIWIAAVIGIFVVGQFIEGNILQPRLVGSSIGVHPVWLMFALFAFGSLFGFVGLLLAVPLTAALGVLVRFAVARYQESRIYQGGSAELPPDASV
ncbi:AI-2E family transporter [Propylenella binzhouense]|uniref:AI-2E family transporter n=1 Tax=Propylenella binzhouense TaxID=2555902 RepID=UPI001967EA70|nr:AI-2E family transporter [Propylenella binzhouense]